MSFRLDSDAGRAIDRGWNSPEERAGLFQLQVSGAGEFLACSRHQEFRSLITHAEGSAEVPVNSVNLRLEGCRRFRLCF